MAAEIDSIQGTTQKALDASSAAKLAKTFMVAA